MLAIIKNHRNALTPLRYNENKVAQGKAETIWAENFLKDHDRLSLQDKLDRFDQRISLNERVVNNMMQISVNFGKTEQLSNQRMKEIAAAYMSAMTFGDQPYIVYRHNDAGHTHFHIVTTSIRADGSNIDIRKRQLAQSLEISRQLEQKFSLQPNRRSRVEDKLLFEVQQAQKVVYGEPGLKRAISDVLNTVVDRYKYTSLEELNAALRLYNVEANPGTTRSHLREKGGLLYHALDDNGNRIGVPIKANHFLLKPTLKHLERQFKANQHLRQEAKDRITTAIEWSLSGRPPDWEGFRESLARKGISIMPADDGKLYFIDHQEKAVFDSKTLSNEYNADSLRNRCVQDIKITEEQELKQHLNFGL